MAGCGKDTRQRRGKYSTVRGRYGCKYLPCVWLILLLIVSLPAEEVDLFSSEIFAFVSADGFNPFFGQWYGFMIPEVVGDHD